MSVNVLELTAANNKLANNREGWYTPSDGQHGSPAAKMGGEGKGSAISQCEVFSMAVDGAPIWVAGAPMLSFCPKPSIGHEIFETNSSFCVKQHTTDKV